LGNSARLKQTEDIVNENENEIQEMQEMQGLLRAEAGNPGMRMGMPTLKPAAKKPPAAPVFVNSAEQAEWECDNS